MIGGAAEHHSIDVRHLRLCGLHRGDAAVEYHRQCRALALEPVGPVVAQWRDLAVFLWRQALQPRIARMHDDHRCTRLHLRIDKAGKGVVVVVLVHAEPAFHRDRDVHRRGHRRHAFAHQRRLAHQASAETPGLHAVGRAAAVEVDLVVAPLGGDARGLREQGRIAAAQLQGQRVFAGVKAEQTLAVTMDHRIGVHHLGIEPRAGGEDAVEDPAMGVSPIHHRGHGQAQGGGIPCGRGGCLIHYGEISAAFQGFAGCQLSLLPVEEGGAKRRMKGERRS